MRTIIILLVGVASALGQARQVVVISHRGEHRYHPENTLPAFCAAFEAGADFIEVDVRTTSDDKLVLMHNDTVDARTNGSGAVKDMTFEQLRALDAGVKTSQEFAGTPIPTFDEALEFARGKIGVYVDTKRAAAADIVAAIERHDMQDRVVIYGGYEYLKKVAAMRPKMKVMPESVSVGVMKKLIDELKPKVIAFDARDFRIVLAKPIVGRCGRMLSTVAPREFRPTSQRSLCSTFVPRAIHLGKPGVRTFTTAWLSSCPDWGAKLQNPRWDSNSTRRCPHSQLMEEEVNSYFRADFDSLYRSSV
jgi:glycerophosphoryl diester phosphodiesterase